MTTLSTYRWWLTLCFASGHTSVALRSFLPTIIQSIAHSLGHQQNTTNSCTLGSTCFITLLGSEINCTSYVHALRSLSTVIEILVTLYMAPLSDSENKHTMFSGCLLLLIITSLLFFFVECTAWSSLYFSSMLYMLMLSVIALTETIQSSFIPIFMRNGIEGMVASSESFLVTNIASLCLLLVSVFISFLDFSMSISVFLGGAMGLVAYVYAQSYEVDPLEGELSQSSEFEYKSLFREYPELMKLCGSWVLFTCAMTNFVMNLNLMFRINSDVGASDLGYTCFVLASYISASSMLYLIRENFSKISTGGLSKAILSFSSISVVAALYCSLGWFLPFGLVLDIEFWALDVLYIACASGFRAVVKPIYGRMIPRGLESHLYGFEVVGGLVGTALTGALSATIQNYTGDGHGCFLMSAILSILSIWLFVQTDIASGQRRVATVSLLDL